MVTKNAKLSVVRHFRLSGEEARCWDEKVLLSGMTHSEFFRQAVLQNQTTVRARLSVHPYAREIKYLLAKQGNNINQIARNLNTDRKSGGLSEAVYRSALRELAILNESAADILSAI